MTSEFAELVAAAAAFVGSHFALSHPLRGALVRRLGEGAFAGLYSLVALAAFVWLALAFRAAAPTAPLWDGLASGPWIAATLLMLAASVMLVGSFLGNPALSTPNSAALAAKAPQGVFQTTRHPMMWSFALWSAAHSLVSPSPRVIVLSLAVAVLALVGSHLQDRKKAVLMGAAWQGWEARTGYWPKLSALGKAGMVPWLGGIALWLVATWAHGWLGVIPAGVWRWI